VAATGRTGLAGRASLGFDGARSLRTALKAEVQRSALVPEEAELQQFPATPQRYSIRAVGGRWTWRRVIPVARTVRRRA